MKAPSGRTPLCTHVTAVIADITRIAPMLVAHGHKAVVVIATDGKPDDGDLAEAMAPMQVSGLPNRNDVCEDKMWGRAMCA
jgi:hypothetical protein